MGKKKKGARGGGPGGGGKQQAAATGAQPLYQQDSPLVQQQQHSQQPGQQQQPQAGGGGKRSKKKGNAAAQPALPPLIQAGEWVDQPQFYPCFMPAKDRRNEALKEKFNGNKAFTQQKYRKALKHYSNAIKYDSEDPVFYSNRALVYLKLGRFHESIVDCTLSLQRKQTIKAFARRAAARSALRMFQAAAQDYYCALEFEPRNQDCLLLLRKCLQEVRDDLRTQLAASPNDARIAAVRSSIHQVDVSLASIENQIDTLKHSAAPTSKGCKDEELLPAMHGGTCPHRRPESTHDDFLQDVLCYAFGVDRDHANTSEFRRKAVFFLMGELDKCDKLQDAQTTLGFDPSDPEIKRKLLSYLHFEDPESRQAVMDFLLQANKRIDPSDPDTRKKVMSYLQSDCPEARQSLMDLIQGSKK